MAQEGVNSLGRLVAPTTETTTTGGNPVTTNIVSLSASTSIPNIRMIPGLNNAALLMKKDQELLLWYCLRALDSTGKGYVNYNPILEALVHDFGYSRRTLMRLFRRGEGVLWERYINSHSTINIYGVKRVSEYFVTYDLGRHIEVAISDIPKGVQGKRGLLYSTGTYQPQDWTNRHPISRQSLEEKTGIEARQQRRYDVASNTVRQETKVKRYDPITHKRYTVKQQLIGANGVLFEKAKQKGNLYTAPGQRSRKGQLRKVGKAVRRQIESLVTAEAQSKFPKRYYNTFQTFLKRYLKGKAPADGCYYPLKSDNSVLVECLMLNS